MEVLLLSLQPAHKAGGSPRVEWSRAARGGDRSPGPGLPHPGCITLVKSASVSSSVSTVQAHELGVQTPGSEHWLYHFYRVDARIK